MSLRSAIQAVIFDMDGVLTDSEPLINSAAVEMFREKGLKVQPDDFLPFVGTGEDRYLSGVAERYQFPLDVPAAKQRTYEIYLRLVPERLEAFQGAIGLVWACRQAGLRVAVASSADLVKIEANLKKIGLPPEFWDAVVSSEDVLNKKPAPDIFLAAARKLSLLPTQCAVVEDAVNGVQAAKSAGTRCVAVAHTFPADQLLAADLVKTSISQLAVSDLLDSQASPPLANDLVDASFGIVGASQADATARPVVWGFWATIGFGLLVGIGMIGAQILAAIVFSAVAAAFQAKVDWAKLGSNGLYLSIATCASTPVIVGLAWLFSALRKGLPPREYLALKPVGPWETARWCLLMLAVVVLSDVATALLGKPVVPVFMREIYTSAGFLPLLWVVLIVFAPIGEEVLFRGFVFQGLLHSPVGALGAILISSALWSGIHLQYDAFGMGLVFIGGLFLGCARWKTGSIYPCMIMHGFMNLIATLELVLQQQFGLLAP